MSTLIFLIMDYNPKSMANLSKNALSVPNLDNESIGKRLARLRKVRGYSQAQLARKVGIEPKLISDYETGKLRLYDMVLGRIAIALDVTTDTILGFNKLKSIDLKPSLRIWKRLKKIQQLPSSKQKRMLATAEEIAARKEIMRQLEELLE